MPSVEIETSDIYTDYNEATRLLAESINEGRFISRVPKIASSEFIEIEDIPPHVAVAANILAEEYIEDLKRLNQEFVDQAADAIGFRDESWGRTMTVCAAQSAYSWVRRECKDSTTEESRIEFLHEYLNQMHDMSNMLRKVQEVVPDDAEIVLDKVAG